MAILGECGICGEHKSIVAGLMVTVSSTGGRKRRSQRYTKTLRICRKCSHTPAMARELMQRAREALREVLSEQWGKGAEEEADERWNGRKPGVNTGATLLDL